MQVNDKRPSQRAKSDEEQKLDQAGKAPKVQTPLTQGPIATPTPTMPAGVFENAQQRPPAQRQQVTPELAPAVDVAAAIATHVLPLVADVEGGLKPPPGMKAAAAGAVTDEHPFEQGVPFGHVLRQVTSDLRAMNAKEGLFESVREMVVLTAALTPPAQIIAKAPQAPPVVLTKVAELMKSTGDILTGKRQGAPQAFEEIVIPGPDVVAMEQGMLSGFDFSSMDVETMAMIVMFQASDDANQDLRDMLKQMSDTKQKKDMIRAHMNKMKDIQEKADQQLRSEYNRRQRLPKDDPDYIPPSVTFDQFKLDERLNFEHDGDGGLNGTSLAGGVEYGGGETETTTGGPNESGGTNESGETTNTGGAPPLTEEQKRLAEAWQLKPAVVVQMQALYELLKSLFPNMALVANSFASFLWNPKLPPEIAPYDDGTMLASGGGGDYSARNAGIVEAYITRVQAQLKPDVIIDRLKEMYYQDLTLDMFVNGIEHNSTNEDSKRGIAKLKAELEARRAKFDQLASVGGMLGGSEFTKQLAEMKFDTHQAFEADIKANWLEGGRIGKMSGDTAAKLADLLVDGHGDPGIFGLNSELQGVSKAYKALATVVRNLGLQNNELKNLLHTNGDDKKKLKRYLEDTAAELGGSREGVLERQRREAREAHQLSPSPGSLAALTKAFNDVIAALHAPANATLKAALFTATAALSARQTSDEAAAKRISKEEKDVSDVEKDEPRTRGPRDTEGKDTKGDTDDDKEGTKTETDTTTSDQQTETNNTGSGAGADDDRAGLRGSTGTFAEIERMIQAEKDKLDSISEVGEQQQLRLQMYMDAVTGIHATLSNMFKKFSDTAGGIVANLK
ncbi:MAG: hypothetical protein IT381_14940 [Deltaproteobacteria bacterium]|nr:hypothetical protein [Deltaproteobacteria bacterium]